MKKLFKILAFMLALNFIIGSSLYGWVAYSVVLPSLEGTGITITDLIFKKDIDPVMAQKLQQNVNARGLKLGNDTADKFLYGFTTLLVPSNSNVPAVNYPPLDEKTINDIQAAAAKKGTEEGLQILKDAEIKFDAIRKQSLIAP